MRGLTATETNVSTFKCGAGLEFGGSLPQVLPAVSMTLAARKKGSCNSRLGMLLSAVLCLVSIIGGVYCSVIAIFAISKGPLICEKGSNTLDHCDYTLGNLSNFESLNFDLAWFLEGTCVTNLNGSSRAVNGIQERKLPDLELDFEINEDTQKLIHIIVFVALAVVGLLEVVTSVSQIVAGLFGLLCGTSKRHSKDDYDYRREEMNLGYMNQNVNQPQWRG